MTKFIVSFDHGINTERGNGATIAERFDAYASARHDDMAVITDHYKAGPFPRWNMVFGANQALAEARAKILTHWHLTHQEARIALAGHSNGCDIARRTAIILDDLGIPVSTIVFVAAPLKRTIEGMGLEGNLTRQTRIANWVMEQDEVLAPDNSPIQSALRWPYGNAGKVGIDDADGWVRRFEDPDPRWQVYNRRFPWRHSEPFTGPYENAVFETIIKEIRSEPARPQAGA